MSIEFRIDAGGSSLVSPDTASTEAKYFMFLAIALMQESGADVQYHADSIVADIAYDRNSGTISWKEGGEDRAVTLQNPSLVATLSGVFQAVDAGVDPSPTPTLEEISSVVGAKVEGAEAALRNLITTLHNQRSSEHALLVSHKEAQSV